jgi:hypothetical protein
MTPTHTSFRTRLAADSLSLESSLLYERCSIYVSKVAASFRVASGVVEDCDMGRGLTELLLGRRRRRAAWQQLWAAQLFGGGRPRAARHAAPQHAD